MPLTLTVPRILGSTVRVFREGASFTLPSAGTAGPESLPGPTDAGWVDWGCVADAEIDPQSEEKQIWCGTAGPYEMHHIIKTKEMLKIKLKLQYFGPISVELGFNSGALTSSSTAFTPNVGSVRNFWVELGLKDQTSTQILKVPMFCYVKLGSSLKISPEVTDTEIELTHLKSSLDAGVL